MSISLLLKKANNLFKNGSFYKGLELYRKIWIKYPKNNKLFHDIDNLKIKYTPNLKTSLTENDINNYFALHENGGTSKVIKNLETRYNKNKKDFYVLNLLGTFNALINNFSKAEIYQKLSIRLNPFDTSNYLNLASTFQQKKQYHLILPLLEISKLLDFNNIQVNKLLAKQYSKDNKVSSSISVYEHLINLDADNLEIKLDFIKLLINNNEVEKGLKFLQKIPSNKISKDRILTFKALAYFKLNDIEKSKRLLNSALEINSKNPEIYIVFGLIYEYLGDIDKAIESYIVSIKLDDKNPISFNNLGACYAFNGQTDLAILNFKKSTFLDGSFYDAIYRLGQMQIYNFEFIEGWHNFKKRWLSSDYNHKKFKTSKPLMDDLNTKDLNILAWNEQGLGDQIMYGSMFNELSKKVNKLIIRIDKRLINIFRLKHPQIQFVGTEDTIDEKTYDKHIPFGHLGNHFRLNKIDFQNSMSPYVTCNQKTKSFILDKYKDNKTLLVGLTWSSANHLLSENKSLNLEILLPVLSIKQLKFINLDYKNTFEEVSAFRNKYGIEILKEESIDNFYDIEGLSSIIDACDFIISCSNTNAHLSGALSKKTYLLLAKGKGRLWNWNVFKDHSIWYPNTKIFEQKKVGDWQQAIQNLKGEILKNDIKIK